VILNEPGPLATLVEQQPLLVRGLVRSVLRVEDLARLYTHARAQHQQSLAAGVLHGLEIKVEIDTADLAKIPKSGPLVVVANHPFGLLDGLVLQDILQRARPDIKLLANDMLCDLPEVRDQLIPVDVFADRASARNVRTVRQTLRWLSEGHGIALFPSGVVSHWNQNERRIADPEWSTFPVRCARVSRSPILPIYFVGRNSLAFHVAGFIHPRLRTASLPIELLNKRGATVQIRIGKPIAHGELADAADDTAAIAHVRTRVYLLQNRRPARKSNTPHYLGLPSRARSLQPICAPVSGVEQEIEQLARGGKLLVQNDYYAAYKEIGHRIPRLVSEIGRLREITFREVHEGTGMCSDLDEFDPCYTHLILWHKQTAGVAGAYRLTWTADARSAADLYTSNLFRYAPEFFSTIGPAVELGRSFITPEHQREYAPLLLLWQAIARCVADRPDSPVLFGAVSISTSYPTAAREMIVQFLRERSFRTDLSPFVSPRRAFHPRLIRNEEMQSVIRCLQDLDDLPIEDLGPDEGVPVLLRQYLRLGGQVAAFNVDAKFSDVLDALLIVDLRLTPRRLLARYMGTDMCTRFLEAQSGALPVAKQ
jgi:putative hemolysin